MNEKSTLQITYLGYVKKEIKILNQTILNIILEENTEFLDEVVVVGYGIQKKVNVIGSIASVNGDKLESRATSSVQQALTGQMPGVTITQGGGRPGVDMGTIRVRGIGSFGATPSALVLIDGVPGDLNSVSSSEIESISILKDASSAAIYGARAANGVVLVTTKKGKAGKVVVSYHGYAGFNKATELPQFVNSWEYAEALNKADGIKRFTDEDIAHMKNGTAPDSWANENTVDQIFNGSGFQTGHTLTMNGGSEKSQYFTAFDYLSQDGVVEHNNYTKYNVRLNLTSKINKHLTMTARIQGSYATVKEPNVAGSIDGSGLLVGIIQQGLRFPGFRPSTLSDGTWGPGVKGFGTAKAWLASKSFIKNPTARLQSNIRFDYQPINELKFSLLGAFNYTHQQTKAYRATLPVTIDGKSMTLGPSILNQTSGGTKYTSFQAIAEYNKNIPWNTQIKFPSRIFMGRTSL